MITFSTMCPTFTSEFITSALRLPSLQGKEFSFIATDSRKIPPSSLFVALKGEQVDGHDFIPDAIRNGAQGILCRKDYPVPSGVSVFPVDDTLAAFRTLAAVWRKEFSIPVVVIAGSAGKTSTKEILYSIFQGKWKKVHKTQASQNGFIGIPMTLLELRPEHQAAIIEVGIDEIGAMQQHMEIVKGTAGILTSIGPEHLEKLKDVPTVAYEEGIALKYISNDGGFTAINLDDPWIKPLNDEIHSAKRLSYSLEGISADVAGTLLKSQSLRIQSQKFGTLEIPLPLPGKHNATNLLGAATLGLGLGMSFNEIKTGLTLFKGAEGRSQIREFPGSTKVICDYYNAQPLSMNAGIAMLNELANTAGKKWACLADMLEMGPNEEQLHRDLAQPLLQNEVDSVLLYGPRMKFLMDEMQKRRFKGTLMHFSTHPELTSYIIQRIKPGDTVLIKGSRGMRMENIWKSLELYLNGSKNS